MSWDSPVNISLPAGLSFWRAKLLRPGGTARDTAFEAGVGDREPPQIFSCLQNWGIPVLPLASPLPYPPFRPQLRIARKTASPAGKAQKSFTKGKKYKLRHFKTMRVKRMTIEEGKRAGISRFPNFHKTGSVRGMKKLYYGQHCLLVRCGDYIYNVSPEPQIYNQVI